MEVRVGYVSNSSSASSVVVPKEVVENCKHKDWTKDETILSMFFFDRCGATLSDEDKWDGLFDEGEYQFGWQTMEYNDFASKWNWLVLQAYYGGDEYMNKINDFLHEIDGRFEIDWNKTEKTTEYQGKYAYIDHQSVDARGTFDEIAPIGIAEFLLNSECYIDNGNDNGDYDWGDGDGDEDSDDE